MNIRIEWIYRTHKGAGTVFRSDEMSAEQGMQIAEDIEQTGELKVIFKSSNY